MPRNWQQDPPGHPPARAAGVCPSQACQWALICSTHKPAVQAARPLGVLACAGCARRWARALLAAGPLAAAAGCPAGVAQYDVAATRAPGAGDGLDGRDAPAQAPSLPVAKFKAETRTEAPDPFMGAQCHWHDWQNNQGPASAATVAGACSLPVRRVPEAFGYSPVCTSAGCPWLFCPGCFASDGTGPPINLRGPR